MEAYFLNITQIAKVNVKASILWKAIFELSTTDAKRMGRRKVSTAILNDLAHSKGCSLSLTRTQ